MSTESAGDADKKRQKKDEVTLQSIDLSALPDGFKRSIVSAEDGLVLTQDVRAVEALVVKHHKAVLLYKDLLSQQSAAQYKLEARLGAMEVALPAASKQRSADASDLATTASTAAAAATLQAEACDGRVTVLTAQLNEFAATLAQNETSQQEALGKHLQVIEGTFLKCDNILQDVRASVMSVGAAAAPPGGVVLDTPHQEMAALRTHVDSLHAVIQAVGAQAKETEDSAIHGRVQANELTAWCNNASKKQSEAMSYLDSQLRGELRSEFGLIKAEFDTVKLGLCQCPEGCPGKLSQQTKAPLAQPEPDRFLLTPPHGGAQGTSEATGAQAGRLPLINKGRWTGTGGNGGPDGGGDDPEGGDDGDEDWGDDASDGHRRGRRGHPSHRSLTRESKNPFDCKEKADVEKYNGKENKLWRKKTTNFLASRFPDVHPLVLWAERQKEAITDDKLAAGCFGDPVLAKAQLTQDYASVISFHLWGFLNTKLIDDAWGLFDSADMWAGLEVWRPINLEVT